MTKPYLSIVIPTLNEEMLIGNLLLKLLAQEMSFEIIVSDSGSTDRTEHIVKTIAAQHPDKSVRFLHAPIKGVSVARNNGAAYAKSNLILFLDADNRISPDFLRNAYLEVKRRNLDGAGCHQEPDSDRLVDKAVFSFYRHCIINPLQYTNRPGSGGAGLIVKKSIHKKIGGFDQNLQICEDLDYIQKISKVGRFRMLKSTRILANMRRFDQEGRPRIWFKYVVWGSCYLFNLKQAEFKYEFGKFNNQKP